MRKIAIYDSFTEPKHRRLIDETAARAGFTVDIHAFSFKARFGRHVDFQQQITVFSTVSARHTLAPQTNALSIIDACRNVNLEGLLCTIGILEIEVPIRAECRLIKGYIDIGMNIFTVLREAAVTCTSAESGKSGSSRRSGEPAKSGSPRSAATESMTEDVL